MYLLLGVIDCILWSLGAALLTQNSPWGLFVLTISGGLLGWISDAADGNRRLER